MPVSLGCFANECYQDFSSLLKLICFKLSFSSCRSDVPVVRNLSHFLVLLIGLLLIALLGT
jgi:hypothetical protein